jgi:hypothetical protein
MITETELHERLKEWIREYGPGGLPHEATTNLIHTLVDHKGFVPSGGGFRSIPLGTLADEVEGAVCDMESAPGRAGDENVSFKAAKVLRAYYLTPIHWPEEERIRRLRLIGLSMGRHTYYRFVQLGRAYLMGYLSSREKVANNTCVAT